MSALFRMTSSLVLSLALLPVGCKQRRQTADELDRQELLHLQGEVDRLTKRLHACQQSQKVEEGKAETKRAAPKQPVDQTKGAAPKRPVDQPRPPMPTESALVKSVARMLATKYIPTGSERDVVLANQLLRGTGAAPSAWPAGVAEHISSDAKKLFWIQLSLTSGVTEQGILVWNRRDDNSPILDFSATRYTLVEQEFDSRLDKSLDYWEFIVRKAPQADYKLAQVQSVLFEGPVERSRHPWHNMVKQGVSYFVLIQAHFNDGTKESLYTMPEQWGGIGIWQHGVTTFIKSDSIREFWIRRAIP